MTTLKRTGVPAVPVLKDQPDLVSFLRAVKQNLERLEELVAELTATVATCTKYTAGQVYTNNPRSSGAFVPVPSHGDVQFIINNGAHTWVPPTQNCKMSILLQNGPSAGAITTTDFTKVTGTPPVTTTQFLFVGRITVIGGKSWLEWQALQ
jgi:hypothetical protein